MIYKIIALMAAFLTSTGFIPQIIKGYQTKHVKDVSLVMLIFTAFGTFFWTIYGFYLADIIIIGANIFTCSSVLMLVFMKFIYKQQ